MKYANELSEILSEMGDLSVFIREIDASGNKIKERTFQIESVRLCGCGQEIWIDAIDERNM